MAVLFALLPGIPLQALAQATPAPEAAGGGHDHRMVLARTVNPRIAYRGLPATENPTAVEAVTFPGRVFDTAMGQLDHALVGDDALARTAPVGAGMAVLSTVTAAAGAGPTGVGPDAALRVPLGSGATTTGALGGLGRGLGERINTALRPLSSGGGQ